MKKAIYTISKNEEHNVKGFMQSAEGCSVYVLDTGSTDNTVELLKEHGAHVVQKIIDPWRFDTAREEALALVPDDVEVCVSVDMDERLESGWQDKLDQQWQGNLGNYDYIAEWADEDKTIPSIRSPRTRLHSRHGFEWHRKIHEVLRALDGVQIEMCDTNILVKHYSNGIQRNYIPALLELLEESPNDEDAWLQLAGEHLQKKQYQEALTAYEKYIRLTFDNESRGIGPRKANVFLSIGHCKAKLDDINGCVRAYLNAIASEPDSREAWTYSADLMLQLGNAELAYGMAITADKIKKPPYGTATDASVWGDVPSKIAQQAFSQIAKRV